MYSTYGFAIHSWEIWGKGLVRLLLVEYIFPKDECDLGQLISKKKIIKDNSLIGKLIFDYDICCFVYLQIQHAKNKINKV